MAEITLDNGVLRTVVNPEYGASLAAFFAKSGEDWLPLMPDSRRPEIQLDSACFLMIPYSNRIENGTFAFQGQTYQLQNAEDHAIHGDVRFRPWSIVGQTAHSLCCLFNSRDHNNINWPWPFETLVECALDETALTIKIILWNRGDAAMPAGLGWHPYFSRTLTREGEPMRLRFATTSVYPDTHDNRIPSGPPRRPDEDLDFSTEKILPPDLFIDSCYQGYDGNGHIVWPGSNVKIVFDCSPACRHLVLYNPLDKPYFAVEPVTNANNGINLYSGGEPDSGVVILPPDECLEASFTLRVLLSKDDWSSR